MKEICLSSELYNDEEIEEIVEREKKNPYYELMQAL